MPCVTEFSKHPCEVDILSILKTEKVRPRYNKALRQDGMVNDFHISNFFPLNFMRFLIHYLLHTTESAGIFPSTCFPRPNALSYFLSLSTGVLSNVTF